MSKNVGSMIDDLVGTLTDPIIVYPGGWGDSLPEWLKNAITLERLTENMKGTKGEQPTGTDAEAVRNRRFHDVAVQAALASGRLTILRDSDGSVFLDIIKVEIESYPQKEIGIFAHSNAAVSDLADQT